MGVGKYICKNKLKEYSPPGTEIPGTFPICYVPPLKVRYTSGTYHLKWMYHNCQKSAGMQLALVEESVMK